MVALAEQRTFVIEELGNVLPSPKIVIPNLAGSQGRDLTMRVDGQRRVQDQR